MSDIVERLRAEATENMRYEVTGTLALEAAARIEQLEAALRDILSKSCDAFYETANMLDDDDFSGEVPGRSGTVIGHREEYHRYMVEALTKAGDAAREALTAMEQRT